MYYPDEIVDDVRTRNDIVDVIGGYVKLQKKGSSYFGLCPFHSEKTASFSVSRQKQMFYCFGCGKGGNVFTFIEEYENFTFPESVKYLADRAGIKLPEQEESEEDRKKRARKQQLLDVSREAALFYCYILGTPGGDMARRYLKGRGLSDQTVKSFGLGYAPKYSDMLYKYLKKKGWSDDILKESGLFHFDEKHGASDRFFNRVMFPIMDVNNKVIAFGGRVMGDALPKYLNSPETPLFDKGRNLYGLNTARTSRKDYAILCEGYMDVISMHQAGFTNAMASLGTSLTTGQAILLKRYFDKAVIAYDSDGAGRTAALRAVPILRNAGFNVKVLSMDPFKDPDEFIGKLGVEEFENRIRDAMPGFLFELKVLEERYDMNDPSSKTSFYRDAASRFLIFEDPLERNNYIEAFCRRYDIPVRDMTSLVEKAGLRGASPSGERTEQMAVRTPGSDDDVVFKAQRMFMTFISESRENFEAVKDLVGPADMAGTVYAKTAEMIYSAYEKGEKIEPAGILDRFDDREDQNTVAAMFSAGMADGISLH
ncbi:MAG: DNA primase, partial [Lachnospiraceae bacterium]|nr:DNA primase [Lachnospiraceae bacterium]